MAGLALRQPAGMTFFILESWEDADSGNSMLRIFLGRGVSGLDRQRVAQSLRFSNSAVLNMKTSTYSLIPDNEKPTG